MTRSARLARTSPLAVLALTAVLVASAGAGGAVAGSLVTSKQIKNNTIVSKDVRTGGLNGTDLADSSVGGGDIADGSLAAGDLGTGARQELRGLLASGVVDGAGVLRFARTAPGVTVTATRSATGFYCLRLTGVAASAANTGFVVSANYGLDSTGTTTSAVVEGDLSSPSCPDGFPVTSLLQNGTTLALSNQGFSFMIG